MANLDKSNVVNGNIISASDVSALYDTFTGDNTANNINILGNNNNFAGTSSLADRIKYVDDNANKFYEVPFLATESQGNYAPVLTDTNDTFQYNPSTNTLKATNFEGTGSFITGSNVEGAVEIASNLDTFTINDTTGNPTPLPSPRPIAATVVFPSGGSGSIDLASLQIATSATTLGTDIFVHGQTLVNTNTIDTADTLEINYTPPSIFSVTSSNASAQGAILIGWTTS